MTTKSQVNYETRASSSNATSNEKLTPTRLLSVEDLFMRATHDFLQKSTQLKDLSPRCLWHVLRLSQRQKTSEHFSCKLT